MTLIETILTHPGGAHKDEFLACSVLLALHPVPLVRREPTPEDLANPAICVVDVGHQHEPALHNFDHHQLPKDHPPTCSLSLSCSILNFTKTPANFVNGSKSLSGSTAAVWSARRNGWAPRPQSSPN